MVKKPEKVGGQKVATGGLCRGRGGAAPAAGSKGVWGQSLQPLKIFAFFT